MDLWNTDAAIMDIDDIEYDVPAWIDDDISPQVVAAIVQGGCDSGAYMPAVTYWQALKTMTEHGDDVFQYIEDVLGDIPDDESYRRFGWSQMAVYYLSTAVELWAIGAHEALEQYEKNSDLEVTN